MYFGLTENKQVRQEHGLLGVGTDGVFILWHHGVELYQFMLICSIYSSDASFLPGMSHKRVAMTEELLPYSIQTFPFCLFSSSFFISSLLHMCSFTTAFHLILILCILFAHSSPHLLLASLSHTYSFTLSFHLLLLLCICFSHLSATLLLAPFSHILL